MNSGLNIDIGYESIGSVIFDENKGLIQFIQTLGAKFRCHTMSYDDVRRWCMWSWWEKTSEGNEDVRYFMWTKAFSVCVVSFTQPQVFVQTSLRRRRVELRRGLFSKEGEESGVSIRGDVITSLSLSLRVLFPAQLPFESFYTVICFIIISGRFREIFTPPGRLVGQSGILCWTIKALWGRSSAARVTKEWKLWS